MRLLLFFVFLFNACSPGATHSATMSATDHSPAAGAGTIPYLALGDSYTIGEGAPEADRWPVQLAALARAQGQPLAAPDIIARTGWTTAELLEAIAASGNHRTNYGLVSLLIGVNNQYRGQSPELYRAELRELLARAVRFAGGRPGRVLVLSIPDWGRSPFGAGRNQALVSQQIDEFNQVAQAECRQAGVAFVDITLFTRQAGLAPAEYVADGLHYSGTQMRQWAGQALPVVQRLLAAAGGAGGH